MSPRPNLAPPPPTAATPARSARRGRRAATVLVALCALLLTDVAAQLPGAGPLPTTPDAEALTLTTHDTAPHDSTDAGGRESTQASKGSGGAAAKARDTRPNIVLITSDDQTDTELAWMPKTRKLLGKAGINFTDGINPHPLCCPARAEILTGEYAQNNGVRHNKGRYGGYAAFMRHNADEHIGVWLRRAGYHTAFIGKTMNGYDRPSTNARRMPGWDYWSATRRGTYAFYGTEFTNNGSPKTYQDTYVADVVRNQTNERVKQWSKTKKPFFIWASHVGPHDAIRAGRWGPPVPARRHAKMFSDTKIPTRKKPSFREKDRSDKPAEVRRVERKPDMVWKFRERIRSLQAIDEANASLIKTLRRTGQLDNTIIVYVSDNGFQLGEHDLLTKNFPYEESLQIPFLMRGPGIGSNGNRSRQTASIVDLAPTFLDAAGVLARVRKDGHTDGESLLPVAAKKRTLNDTTLIQAGPATRKQTKVGWMWRGVRTSRYTYVLWWNGFEELYDRREDPYQMDNLSGAKGKLRDGAYRGVRDELSSRLKSLRNCKGLEQCERQEFGAEPQPSGNS